MSDQVYVENVDDVVEERSNTTPWWVWILLLLLVTLVIGGIFLFREIRNGVAPVDTSEKTSEEVTSSDEYVSWKEAVQYEVGGSGPPDPAVVFNTDLMAVDHNNRLIVGNPELDARLCFPQIDDENWQKIVDWANQWGEDSPTRVEWQINESRCSWVFPGDITDSITQEDYEEILEILSDVGYSDTWFVSGLEGEEFGRSTYTEIMSASSYINRVHVYGNKLPSMPILVDSD